MQRAFLAAFGLIIVTKTEKVSPVSGQKHNQDRNPDMPKRWGSIKRSTCQKKFGLECSVTPSTSEYFSIFF
jgi:hypothetical protein